ncbi:MAG TPA: DUF5132 domain-containing protein, partial [Isosphaeraceae bacterium]
KDAVGKSLPGFMAGALTASVLLPLMGGRRGRTLAKAAVRGYLSLADRLKENAAEARERFHDLVAEVQQERQDAAEADSASVEM